VRGGRIQSNPIQAKQGGSVQRGGGGVEFFFRIKKAAGKGLQIAGRRNPRWGGGDWEGGAPTRFAIRNRQAGRAAGAGGREGRLGAGLSLGGGARVWGICPDLGGDGSERRGRWRGSSACCVALMLSPPSPMNGLLLRRLLRLLLACSAQRCCCCCWPAAAVGGCVRACVRASGAGREERGLCYAMLGRKKQGSSTSHCCRWPLGQEDSRICSSVCLS
jgi:hypothetical protein